MKEKRKALFFATWFLNRSLLTTKNNSKTCQLIFEVCLFKLKIHTVSKQRRYLQFFALFLCVCVQLFGEDVGSAEDFEPLLKKNQPSVTDLFPQQPFWLEVVGSQQVFPVMLIKVPFRSHQKESRCCSHLLRQKNGSAKLNWNITGTYCRNCPIDREKVSMDIAEGFYPWECLSR